MGFIIQRRAEIAEGKHSQAYMINHLREKASHVGPSTEAKEKDILIRVISWSEY